MGDKILFVDDEPAVLDSYARMLHRGFEVDTALGGELGLAAIHDRGPYSVVISDMRMPAMSGAQFLSRVREAAPHTVRMLLTGHSDVKAAMEAINEGNVFRYLTKPCQEIVLGNAIAAGLVQYRLAMARKESARRVAQELEVAKQVQARFLPQEPAPLKTLEYAGICIQARQVGGDYYDFLALGQQRFGLVVGDVAGKGIAAALLMANLQANLRSQSARASNQVEPLLRSVNQLFCDNTGDNSYATLFFAEYDDRVGRLTYANCGHLAGLLLRSNGAIERLTSTCTVLGLFKEWNCSTRETLLFPGDALALYTDGVTEAFNETQDEFGEHRLLEALRRYRELPSKMLLRAVVNEVHQFSPHEQYDDITLIVAKCREH